MKPITVIAFSAAGLIAYSLLRKSAALGTLNFFPAGVRDLSFDGVTPVITIGLAAQNTSNQNFTMNSIAGNVFANNYFVGNVSSFEPLTIPANKQTIIPIKIRLSLIGIVNDIIRAFQTNNISQVLELESFANVDNLQVPINLKYKVGL